MKPEETNKTLEAAKAKCEWNAPLDYQEAFDVAISALQVQDVHGTNDGDTISRQAAIDAIEAVFPVDPMKSEFAQGVACGAALSKIYIEQLPSAQPEQKWIPCSERLPEEHIGFYLVTVQKRRITALNVVGCDNTVYDIVIARWDYDRRAPQRGYHWCKEDKVIAWMPLPEAYNEGDLDE